MKKTHIILIISIFLLAVVSCRKSSQINPDANLKLEFSADTVLFDTVFTSLGSATHELRIYNRHSDDLKISSIRLIGGESSPFRLNVDGENNIEIYVTNLPANRIAKLDRDGVKWRKFNEINVVDLNYKRDTYEKWNTVASGLNSNPVLVSY